jgi:hypothetical protein
LPRVASTTTKQSTPPRGDRSDADSERSERERIEVGGRCAPCIEQADYSEGAGNHHRKHEQPDRKQADPQRPLERSGEFASRALRDVANNPPARRQVATATTTQALRVVVRCASAIHSPYFEPATSRHVASRRR